uniref:type I methionyl aminopeptidase n=1 Tax=Candidatus Ventrenecus sp. TaxID=3085654 RepID=UPI003FF0317F
MNIRSEREIKLMKEAGHINFLAHKEMEKYIRPGITTKELDKKINDFIVSHGGIASCYGYEGFPGHACICINDEVVHGIPGNRRLKDGDIVKLDFTVRKAGYESDMTRTYLVGNVDEKVKQMVIDTEQALYEGIKCVKPGNRIGDISNAIETYAHAHGLSVVEELVGHGIGTDMHEEPDVPNYGEAHKGPVLKEGMVLAIEPMLNLGRKEVVMLDNDWTIVTEDESFSCHFEHTVCVTKDGYEILTGE